MGVPLLVALLGDAAAGPVIGAIVVDLVVTSTLCLALAQARVSALGAATPNGALPHAALLALRGALTNPLPWAIVLGAGFGRARPASCRRRSRQIVRMLGDSATPVALFTIGAVLWRAGNHVHTRTPVAPLPAGGADQAASSTRRWCSALGLAARALGAPVLAVRPDGADPDRGAAEREQRLAPGRALRRRQRPGRADHHGLDGARVRHLLGHRLAVRQGKPGEAVSVRSGTLYTESNTSHRHDRPARQAPAAPDLVDQVYRALLDAISDGSLAPGRAPDAGRHRRSSWRSRASRCCRRCAC